MYTINNLAEELNKSEGDIIQNLIDYKYLKQDKSPSQITINVSVNSSLVNKFF